MKLELGFKYYLGDGENYFIYRKDIYLDTTIRADLFNNKNEKVKTLLVKGGMTDENRSHTDVINHFEVFVMDAKDINLVYIAGDTCCKDTSIVKTIK